MSLWKLDVSRLLSQIENDEENKRLVWKPSELKDNVFEVVGLAKKVFGIKKMLGNPYKIDEKTYAWNYE